MELFKTYIESIFNGSQSNAAIALGVSNSTISKILKNERGITPEFAEKMEALSNGRFKKESFIWPQKAQATNLHQSQKVKVKVQD